ncbi:MAG TPA: tetratricopeptide repeat protein, partial [Ignavibacteriaceae bacterium]|nr:tetratricopeptide repeat protein [Ignavibacteriaceae bacterium]
KEIYIPKAKFLAAKAIELDESLAEAHLSLAYGKFRLEWNWKEAEKGFKRAIELRPSFSRAHELYGLYLSLSGRFEEGIVEMKKAHELDPLSISVSTGLGRCLHFARRYDKAIMQFKKTLDMDPNYSDAHFGLGMTLLLKKEFNESVKELKKAIELSGGRLVMIAVLGVNYAFAGEREKALGIIDELKKRSDPNPVSPWFLAAIYAGLGENDIAFNYLYKSLEEKEGLLVYMKAEPFYEKIKKDPRFKDILSKIGFE